MKELEIVIIILIALLIIGVVYLIFKPKSKTNGINGESLGILKEKVDSIDKSVSNSIRLVLADNMKTFNEDNNTKLERFQGNITETLLKRFDALNKQMDDKLKEMNEKVDKKLNEGLKETSETMSQVRERLQAIDAAQKNIEGLGKEVISLKNVLEGNQTRGQFGEYQLEMVLHNVFGDTVGCYELQYTMKHVKDGDDVRADAVVFMPEPNKMIAIDSKFPFSDYSKMIECEDPEEKENLKKEFANAVKKHITAVKDKYIVENKTAPEALLFIPNDGVFAFIHHELEDVVEYAREKKVVLTSPSTLPAILVTINMVRIEVERSKNAQIISKQLAKLSKDFEMFAKEWEQLSNKIDQTSKFRAKLDNRVNRLTTKFDSISGSEITVEDDQDIEEITISDDE